MRVGGERGKGGRKFTSAAALRPAARKTAAHAKMQYILGCMLAGVRPESRGTRLQRFFGGGGGRANLLFSGKKRHGKKRRGSRERDAGHTSALIDEPRDTGGRDGRRRSHLEIIGVRATAFPRGGAILWN